MSLFRKQFIIMKKFIRKNLSLFCKDNIKIIKTFSLGIFLILFAVFYMSGFFVFQSIHAEGSSGYGYGYGIVVAPVNPVSGNITEDTTWTFANSPYVVTGTVQVLEDTTLTIEPGVTVKFNTDTSLKIDGELIAIGTVDNRITFTSNQAFPVGGDWNGIKFISTADGSVFNTDTNYVSGSIIKHVKIEYAGRSALDVGNITLYIDNSVFENITYSAIISPGLNTKITNNIFRGITGADFSCDNGVIMVYSDQNYIENNLIENSNLLGVGLFSNGSTVKNNRFDGNGCGIKLNGLNNKILNNVITDTKFAGIYYYSSKNSNNTVAFNSITQNQNNGIHVHGNGNGEEITNNNIFNNSGYDFINDSLVDIVASNNYWGTTNSSEIDNKIYDYYDDISLRKVIYEPFALQQIGLDDQTAPTLSEENPVPTPTDDTTPDYTFTSDEAGTISYVGSCASDTTEAVMNNNTITFNELASGIYDDCKIVVTDAIGNESDPLSVSAFTINITDNTAPIITLLGITTVNLYVGNSYADSGATAYDNFDGDITANIIVAGNTIDTDTVGTYIVTYNVSDAASNSATQAIRTVNVILAPINSSSDVELGVTQISANQTMATANGTYANGWKWTFDVTVPMNETTLKMQFNDWLNIDGSSTISVADNIRFYSPQSLDTTSTNPITISALNTYSDEMNLDPNSDLYPTTQNGRQIQIIVEAKIPDGSSGGSYSTQYGIRALDNIAPTAVATSPVVGQTITYTFSEPIQLVSQATGEVTPISADLLGIYEIDASRDYGPEEVAGTDITEANLDSNILTITYTGSLTNQTINYLVDAWGYSITDLDGNRIAKDDPNQMFTSAIGDMTLAKRSIYADQTVNLPQNSFKIGEWTLTGGSAENINVHTFSLDIDEVSGTSFNESDITDLYFALDFLGEVEILPSETASATDNDWNGSFNLGKNEVMTISFYANLGTNVTSGDSFKTDLSVTGVGADSVTTINSTDVDGQTITSADGGATVTLATESPSASNFAQGQALADLAHFTFTNTGSADVVVNGVVLERLGFSSDYTLASVYLFDETTRLTDAATVSDGQVSFNASGGVLIIPGYSSKTISVKGDILSGTAGQTLGLGLVSVTSDTTVEGNFPINGSTHSIFAVTLANVAIGSPLPSSAVAISPANDIRIWQSTFNVTTRKADFTRLVLRQIGSIQTEDIENFRLLIDGVEVASSASFDANGYVTFVFNRELEIGSRTIKVLADVIGDSPAIIQMSLRDKVDIFLTDSVYDVNIQATSIFPCSAAGISVNGGTAGDGGTMTVEKSTTSPSDDVIIGGTDVVLGEWKFTAYDEPIKVETLNVGYIHVNSSGIAQTSTLRNGRIMVNGVQAGSNTTTAKAGTSFTTNFIVTPGAPVIVQVRADIYDNDGTDSCSLGDKITASLSAGSSNAWGTVSSGRTDVPSTNVNANQITLFSGSMTLVKRTSYAGELVNLPQANFKVGEWTLTAGSAEDINIHTLSLDIDEVSGTSFNESDITDLYLVYSSNTSSVKSTALANDNDWSVSLPLEKNEVMTISLYANLGTNVTSGDSFKTDLSITGVGSDSGTTINSTDVDGQTISTATGTITATRAAGTPTAAIFADNQSVLAVMYDFDTRYDAFTINKLVFAIPSVGVTSIQSVNIKDGSTTLYSLPASRTVTFDGISIPVAANDTKTLSVELELTAVGVAAGISGGAITTDFSSGRATPASTGVEAAIADSTASGNAMYVYKAIPTITKVTDSDVQLRNEQETLLKFSIAATGGDISWDQLFFDITKDADTVLASPIMYDVTGGGQTQVAGAFSDNGALVATTTAAELTFNGTTETSVSGTRTYELRATVTGANADGDYVATSLYNDATYAAPTSTANVASVDSDTAIIWSDISAISHTTITSDWSNDYLVNSLPIQNSLNW